MDSPAKGLHAVQKWWEEKEDSESLRTTLEAMCLSHVSTLGKVAEILYINLGLAYQSFHGDLTAIDHP